MTRASSESMREEDTKRTWIGIITARSDTMIYSLRTRHHQAAE